MGVCPSLICPPTRGTGPGNREVTAMAQIEGLGHVRIYVHDLMVQRGFWSRVMGLRIADEDLEGRGMVFLSSHSAEELVARARAASSG